MTCLLVDTGVFWSFAVAESLDLLTVPPGVTVEAVGAVRSELDHKSRVEEPRLARAASLPTVGWIDAESLLVGGRAEALRTIEQERQLFVKPGDGALKHLGEAQMLAIATEDRSRWVLAFEDRDARRVAVARGLRVITTVELLRSAFDAGKPCGDIVAAYGRMRDEGRGVPKGLTRDDLCAS